MSSVLESVLGVLESVSSVLESAIALRLIPASVLVCQRRHLYYFLYSIRVQSFL